MQKRLTNLIVGYAILLGVYRGLVDAIREARKNG